MKALSFLRMMLDQCQHHYNTLCLESQEAMQLSLLTRPSLNQARVSYQKGAKPQRMTKKSAWVSLWWICLPTVQESHWWATSRLTRCPSFWEVEGEWGAFTPLPGWLLLLANLWWNSLWSEVR